MTRTTRDDVGRLKLPRPMRRGAPRRAADRRRRLVLEPLEERTVLSATISGNVFQAFDASGLYPSPVAQSSSTPSSAFLNPVGGVVVTLDGAAKATTGAGGTYQFTGVAPGPHTITIQPPAGYFGASGQSLGDALVVQADQTAYPNLNFALTPSTAAVVQNLYQMVLNRSVGADELNRQVLALQAGKTTIGGVFSALYNSAEFNANSQPVAQVIESFFPGPLDVGALRNAVQLQALGVSQEAVVTQILYSPKFIKAFGDLSRLSDSGFVGSMYTNILGRNPRPAELKSWDAQLAAGLPRADVALSLVDAREYEIRGRNDANQTAVSLAYVGVLGRQPSAREQSLWVARLQAGMSVQKMANALANTTEFKNLKGFTDPLIWDVNAHRIAPPVSAIDRLAGYDPATKRFDVPVAPGSITSTGSSNVYFLVHGWAPGQTQPVLLKSNPGDPLKWWDSSDATWLLNPVAGVSTEGLAQSIVDADPNAKVYAYSWIDESDTATSLNPTQAAVNAYVSKARNVVQVSSVAGLAPGMTVVAPELAPGTYITGINAAQGLLTLSARPVAFNPTATLTVLTSQITATGSLTAGSPVVTGIDTRYLTTGMTVSGSGASIASIDSAGRLTLSQPATTTGQAPLTFTGLGTTVQTQQGTLQRGFATITGLDTSGLSTGMTVVGPDGADLGTVATIDSASEVTILPSGAPAVAGPQALIFKGADLRLLLGQNLYAGQSEAYTQTNGLRLASAIEQALAPGFFTYGDSSGGGLIHLIGHSHGSKVATVATLALQQANVPVAQLTTLESPEAGPQLSESLATVNTHLPNLGGAQNFLWYYMRRMNLSRTPVTGSRGSTNSTFIDNYFSTQGFGTALGAFKGLDAFGSNTKDGDLSGVVDAQMHPEILYGGVSLSNPSAAYPTLQGSHQYPAAWYGQASLRKAPAQPNGVSWSPLVNPSAAPSGDLYQQQTSVTRPATLVDKSASVTGIDTTGLVAGMPVSDGSWFDSYIADGTTIYSIDSPTSLTLSKAAVGGGSDKLIFQVTAAAYLADDDAYQYTLTPGARSSVTPTGPTPLNYVQQYTTGKVTDDGSSITLTVDPANTQAIDAIGFNPLSAQGLNDLGAGMDLQVQFSGVAPGSQVQLVVWIHGLASSPKVAGFPLGSTMGDVSIPLLALDASDAGSSVQYATLSLGQYLNAGFLRAPFNAVNTSDAAAGTMTPTIAFSLIGDGASTASATVSNLRQFSDGVLFS